MATFDFKKERKDLYQPSTAPTIVDVPSMLFLMTDGEGNPNTSETFQAAMDGLYGLSYTIRMSKAEANYYPYVVPPLDGFWDLTDPKAFSKDHSVLNKEDFRWTVMLRQPDFVTPEVLERAKARLQKKKPHLNLNLLRLETFAEGLCVQALHLGSYDSEPATLQTMAHYQEQRGFRLDYTHGRRHHEIYLGRPNAAEPDKMKTILRLPIKRR